MKLYNYILYAPFIHTGGGKTLLIQLLSQIENYDNSLVIIDSRISFKFRANKKCDVFFVKNSFYSYILSEFNLYRYSSKNTRILCLHGAPPLIKNEGYTMVFFHNRLHLDEKKHFFMFSENLKKYFFTKSFIFCDEIIVQTDSMIYAFEEFFKKNSISKKLQKKSFYDAMPIKKDIRNKKFDFIYVADASAHKNHKCLIQAWILLSMDNLRPSLVLTIPKSQQKTIDNINMLVKKYKLKIYNFGDLNQKQVGKLYAISKSLIFPSLVESFGLPLIEASQYNLSIIASELDYVRDVCVPNYTFNPLSALSIARAVKRSLGITSAIEVPYSAKLFFDSIYRIVKK